MSEQIKTLKYLAGDTTERMADFGWKNEKEGRNCMAYSNEEDLAIAYFKDIGVQLSADAEAVGLRVVVEEDRFGNAYISLEGESLDYYVICSHVDSVYNGGRYDGTAGVACGIEVLSRMVQEGKKPMYSVRVAAFRAEESSATRKSCLGSALATGQITVEELKNTFHKDYPGHNMLEILITKFNLTEEEIDQRLNFPFLQSKNILGGFEVHVEQSGVLENANKSIGVVGIGIGAARRSDVFVSPKEEGPQLASGCLLEVKFKGDANHSGGTPMNGEIVAGKVTSLRRDALVAASDFFFYLERMNIMDIHIEQGSVNTVPGNCEIQFVVPEDQKEATLMYGKLYKGLVDVEIEEIDSAVVETQCIRDAVAKAALEIISEVESAAIDAAMSSGGKARATVGTMEIDEGGSLKLGLDQRKLCPEAAQLMQAEIDQILRFKREGVDIEESGVKDKDPVQFKPEFPGLIAGEYREKYGEEPVIIGSMPGHDLSNILTCSKDGKTIPGGMIYIRSLNGGISHNPVELSDTVDVQEAADLLYKTISRLTFCQ